MEFHRVLRRGLMVVALCALAAIGQAGPAGADPEPQPVAADAPAEAAPQAEAPAEAAAADAPPPEAVPPPEAAPPAEAAPPDAPPPDDGRVESTPPATVDTPDGWTLTLGAKDEKQAPIAPLTTALSSREYVVEGVFTSSMSGPGSADPPTGVLEVGYEIGCGIDMSTSNGVALTGTAGIRPSLGVIATDILNPQDGLPVVGTDSRLGFDAAGAITVGLKPGIINVVPVTKKEFTGAEPWVMITGFRVKIDGCVGESFIRSYAYLTRSTDESDAILAWYGVTKAV